MPVPQADPRDFVPGLKQKRPRLRLEPKAYRELSKRVRERDRWRCQNCGTSDSLQVHHMKWRSRLGDDSLENLITLCAQCHKLLHQS
jgi:5-methylcytosine-specific restriction endonuclease McrA